MSRQCRVSKGGRFWVCCQCDHRQKVSDTDPNCAACEHPCCFPSAHEAGRDE